jgi:hypothetical protein
MKKLSMLLLLIVLSLTPIRAQTIPATANLTASDSGACTTAGACLTVNVTPSSAAAVIQLTGTFSATLQFEGTTSSGGTFVAIAATPVAGGSAVTSATATGSWRVTASGFAQIRVRCSAFTSGTVVAAITLSTGSSGTGNGSSGGAVSSVFGRTGAVAATSGDYTASQVTGGGELQDAFYITTACGGKTNCLQLVDDDSTDNCGSPLTTFMAAINAYAGPGQPMSFIEGSGLGKAYKFATTNCHMEFDIPTTIHDWATLDFAQTGTNGIQFGATGQSSYTNAQIFPYRIDGGGTFVGGASLTNAGIEVEGGIVSTYIEGLNFKNFGATNATLGSCTNWAILFDNPVAGGFIRGNMWQVTDNSNGRCAFSNPNGSAAGTNTVLFEHNNMGGQSATNSTGCSSTAILDGGSLGQVMNNNIDSFAIPVRVQGVGHRVQSNQIDNLGCAANGVQAAIQFGATSSSTAVGPISIIGNIPQVTGTATHSTSFFQQAGDSTATITGVTLIGNVNNGSGGNFGVLVQPGTSCTPITAQATYCYEYGNPGMGGIVTCGSTATGWQFEVLLAGCTSSAQAANLGATLLYNPPITKSQLISCQILLTRAATTSSTLPQCVVTFTDVFTNAAQSITLTPVWASGTVGCSGTTTNTVGNSCEGAVLVVPKATVAVNYSTTNYASSGATTMQYQAFVRATVQ